MKNEAKPDWLERANGLRKTEVIWVKDVSASTVRRWLKTLPGTYLVLNRGGHLYIVKGALPNLKGKVRGDMKGLDRLNGTTKP